MAGNNGHPASVRHTCLTATWNRKAGDLLAADARRLGNEPTLSYTLRSTGSAPGHNVSLGLVDQAVKTFSRSKSQTIAFTSDAPGENKMANAVKNVLVVGDWFVDEYWFVVRHHSDVSSHTGQLHYRIASEFEDTVRDLCGAGLVTRILYDLRAYQVYNYNKIIEEVIKKIEEKRKPRLDEKSAALATKDLSTQEELTTWQRYAEGLLADKTEWDGFCGLPTMRRLNYIIEKLGDKVPAASVINEEATIEFTETSNADENERKKAKAEKIEKQYQLVGWGRWNLEDNKIIKHFIHAHCQPDPLAARAPFSLTPKPCDKHVDAVIENLEKNPSEYATTRCIRAYNFVKNRFDQIHRIDWELKPPNPPASGNINAIDSKSPFSDVIICDFKKGVINSEMITEIRKHEKEDSKARWYVRTKSSRITDTDEKEWPTWLQAIDEIELLAIGPEVACRAYPINGLLSDGQLAEHAHRLIKNVIAVRSGRKLNQQRVRNVVLTSDKLEVVVLLGNFCFVAKPQAAIENVDLRKINWTTAFFAALVHEMVSTPNWEDKEDLCRKMVNRALKNAQAYSGVKVPEVNKASTDNGRQAALYDFKADADMPATQVKKVYQWETMSKGWDQAKSRMGLIGEERPYPNQRLEVWRASTDLPGYIACIREKRDAIGRIWQKINAFTQKRDVKNSLSILLEADPAVGKSFLATKLSERLQCKLIEHDITQMIDREELLDLFDRIANMQANSSKPVFVFVDEINATLGGSPVYGAFLSPLEGRKYLRQGQQIELKPCIWMFAGTPRSSGGGDDNWQDEKRADFESRLTLKERIDYGWILSKNAARKPDLDSEAKLEQVYLGAQLINVAFSDVIQIDQDILKTFFDLPPETVPARRIRKLAGSLENVQYGRVHKGNCTSSEWQDIITTFPADERRRWTKEFTGDVKWIDLDLG